MTPRLHMSTALLYGSFFSTCTQSVAVRHTMLSTLAEVVRGLAGARWRRRLTSGATYPGVPHAVVIDEASALADRNLARPKSLHTTRAEHSRTDHQQGEALTSGRPMLGGVAVQRLGADVILMGESMSGER